jgi:hypothetical protein
MNRSRYLKGDKKEISIPLSHWEYRDNSFRRPAGPLLVYILPRSVSGLIRYGEWHLFVALEGARVFLRGADTLEEAQESGEKWLRAIYEQV